MYSYILKNEWELEKRNYVPAKHDKIVIQGKSDIMAHDIGYK